jgi:hypothetical protein
MAVGVRASIVLVCNAIPIYSDISAVRACDVTNAAEFKIFAYSIFDLDARQTNGKCNAATCWFPSYQLQLDTNILETLESYRGPTSQAQRGAVCQIDLNPIWSRISSYLYVIARQPFIFRASTQVVMMAPDVYNAVINDSPYNSHSWYQRDEPRTRLIHLWR